MTLAAAADSAAGFERYRKPTRRDAFLAEMQTLVPRAQLMALIEPHYPKPGNGRAPIGLDRMLRIYLLQHWFNWPTRRARNRCTTRRHCAPSLASTCATSSCPTPRRS